MLKADAARKGIGLIGDLPIFVSLNSADAWAHSDMFRLTKDRQPEVVAGVPPDFFSKTGQRWGNPLYNWERLRDQHYSWWIQRLRRLFQLFDVIRLDHFIGFYRFWEIPNSAPTAETGQYVLGPAASFFEEVFQQLPNASFIAEDLGVVVPEVTQLRDRFQLPGMKVLQFAFTDLSDASTFLPHNFVPNTVVYTGTHDNNTTVGWYTEDATKAHRKYARTYMGNAKGPIHWELIKLAYSSSSNTAIIPMQDTLGLGAKARMNFPGTMKDNWAWRMDAKALTPGLAKKLRELAKANHRI